MGCGSSQDMAIAGSAAPHARPSTAPGTGAPKTFGAPQYKYNVSEVWTKADNMVKNGGDNGKLVIKRSGWKTVRIFVSSTFKDFHAEREVLVKEVFSDLRTWCQARRLHLVDCDLRWGVPKDSTSGETLRLCLGEIDRCYEDNVMPFFLNLTSERCGWIPTFDDVPENIVNEYRWVHGLSVTEMEIMHGAYRTDNKNALFMIRNSGFIKSLPAAYKDDFIDPNPIAVHKLGILKEKLKDRLENRVHWYDCEFSGIDQDNKLEFNGLRENFSQKVYNFFKERIEEQYPLAEASTNPNQVTRESHESFMKSRGETVLGRAEILEKIQHYVTDMGIDYPLVLLGGPGSGKSAITARTADVASTMAVKNEIPGGGDKGWHVFYHFVGAVPGSTDLEKCLKRLLTELDAVNDATMPKNLELTCQMVSNVLAHPKTKPVIVIIDALNQFDDDKAATILSWLPRKIAPQVRVIISMIHETPPHKAIKERGYNPKEIMVTPLDMETRKAIVSEMLKKYNKKLDDGQMNNLMSKQSSQNPLWLAVASEELRVYGVYEKINDKINRLSDGLIELLHQVFDRFEEENGGKLLVATLCLLETSSTGLLETELLQILADEDNIMPKKNGGFKFMKDTETSEKSANFTQSLPAAKWALVYRALKPFLRPFGDSGEGRLDFYHRALSKAVRKKYLKDETDKKWWSKKLADYFFKAEQIDRKVEELPTHLIRIGDTQRLKETLTHWDVLDLLYNEDYCAALLTHWQDGFGGDWHTIMISAYTERIEADQPTMTEDVLSRRYEQIARIVLMAGKHDKSYFFLEKSMNIETNQLGSRPERLVELYELVGTIYDTKSRLVHFVNQIKKSDLQLIIKYLNQSIKIRETLEGPIQKYKLGKTLVRLTFNLSSWKETQRNDANLSQQEAQEQGDEVIARAIDIFKELKDDGMLADALMTKALMLERGSAGQLELYKEALQLALQAYGENSVMGERLHLNTGIYYEDDRQYQKAGEYFVKWCDICEELYGYHHPKSQRARETLEEARYKPITARIRADQQLAKSLKDQLGSSQW